VGAILKDALSDVRVLGELKYEAAEGEKLSPDWIVIDAERCLLIEVSRPASYLIVAELAAV